MHRVQLIGGPWDGRDFECRESETLLEAAIRHGVRLAFGCKGGGCGMCKVKIEEGEFHRGPSSKAVLPDEERALNYTLACKTYPHSHVKVSLASN
ncbi:MAG: 2Fe-2S iron-sulfur cluster binding domain-containing protein [Alicyclobacillus herbarius]|uniref:2Fe-2S iron-sulfur cluster-binding protein n=1 Tax=Alicyclobacillus herbarius TaxID=122960 RepID=UPI000414075D|nr:2Fe-2S iron-sulfur cluster binding domain-containing protein [Alicyclobacillus herbarius]MCL6631826.1 2Fe-2S iron-sulfur cluster binding domain-containing protein [Alicyclobacillus herbarius]